MGFQEFIAWFGHAVSQWKDKKLGSYFVSHQWVFISVKELIAHVPLFGGKTWHSFFFSVCTTPLPCCTTLTTLEWVEVWKWAFGWFVVRIGNGRIRTAAKATQALWWKLASQEVQHRLTKLLLCSGTLGPEQTTEWDIKDRTISEFMTMLRLVSCQEILGLGS